MTTALWTKISLGAVGVFATGMLGITAFREAKHATEHAVAHAVTGAVSAAAAELQTARTFRLEGEPLGRLSTFTIRRAAAGALLDVALEVELADGASHRRLAECDLMPVESGHAGNIDVERGFRCARPDERPLVGVGTVRFTPGEVVRPILVPRRLERELRQGDPFEVRGDVDGGVRVLAQDAKGALVQVRADSLGAAIHIRDDLGRSLLRLLADSTGASLRVRDERGREVVRLEASEGGVSISVDTTGRH